MEVAIRPNLWPLWWWVKHGSAGGWGGVLYHNHFREEWEGSTAVFRPHVAASLLEYL
jgi:hypothetical protein